MERRRQPVMDLPFRRPANLPRRRFEDAEIDLPDIQGNVLRGYTYPHAAYIFLRIDDIDRARVLMNATLTEVATAEPWEDGPPATTTHASFTYAGLQTLGVPEEILASFPAEFREGMAARAERLGDRGPSAPEHWEPGLGTGEAHVLITVHALDNAELEARREVLRQFGQSHGATTVINETRAEALTGGKDHFGFFDGIAQPSLSGSGVEGRPGDGQPNGAGGWRDVCTGEFLHGYVDEDGGLPDAPAAPFDRNGTFEVYRKLQTDVAAFRAYMEEKGRDYPGGPEMLAAKIVGRWPDGTPLATSPDAPDPELVEDPTRINDFGYADDPAGLKCPMGSHIRRANPRDAEGFFRGRMTNRHRIIRRGRTYGPPLPEDATVDDGQDRGLVFVCFNASIWRQFETIQTLWIDDGDPFGLGPDKDFLIGEPDGENGKMTIPGQPPFFLKPQPRFVTMRGGEYLYRPSMSALRYMAGLGGAGA
jgi:Dyp-type peroxidase family